MRNSYDVIVLGSGSSGLAAALAAAKSGASVLVIEKSELVGGTSAMSGAGTWVPANHHMIAAGMQDSAEDALTYMRAVAPSGWREKEDDRWRALAEQSAPMLKFLEDNTPLRFELAYHPDMYSEAPGGREHGRMVSPAIISKNILPKRWRRHIRRSTMPIHATYQELIDGWKQGGSIKEILAFSPRVVWRAIRREVGQGNALITGLLKGCLDAGVEVVTSTRAVELTSDKATGRITGVAVEADGKRQTVSASRGVIIATGGFEWNEALREKHFPGGATLIASPRTNTGDGQLMAEAAGAHLDHMDQANIFPIVPTVYEGKRHGFPLTEIYNPHCILVDRQGRRFVNEGDPNVGVVDERARSPDRPDRACARLEGLRPGLHEEERHGHADVETGWRGLQDRPQHRGACGVDRCRSGARFRKPSRASTVSSIRGAMRISIAARRSGSATTRRTRPSREEQFARPHRCRALLCDALSPRPHHHQGRSAHECGWRSAPRRRQPHRRPLRGGHGGRKPDRDEGDRRGYDDRAVPDERVHRGAGGGEGELRGRAWRQASGSMVGDRASAVGERFSCSPIAGTHASIAFSQGEKVVRSTG